MLGLWHKNSAPPAALEIASLSHACWCIRHVSGFSRLAAASRFLRWCIFTNSRPVHCMISAPPAGLHGQLWEVYTTHNFASNELAKVWPVQLHAAQTNMQADRVQVWESTWVIVTRWLTAAAAAVLLSGELLPSKFYLCKTLWSHKASSHCKAAELPI